jgi:hypothetical protein
MDGFPPDSRRRIAEACGLGEQEERLQSRFLPDATDAQKEAFTALIDEMIADGFLIAREGSKAPKRDLITSIDVFTGGVGV